MNRRLWVRRVILLIALTNLLMMCVGMIYGKRWAFFASGLCWTAWGLILHFFKSDAMPDPAPTTTRILDI